MEMRYPDFKKHMRPFPVITKSLLESLGEDRRVLRNQLSRWQKQKLVVQLKRGVYLLNRDDRAIQPSRFFLANQLLFPSYVSLESALAFYHFIPEAVYQVTSVTTGKTARYSSAEGMFVFRHVKQTLFFGFETMQDERSFNVMVAEPEKALLDFLYLNLAQFSSDDSEVFTNSYRFSNLENLRPDRLLAYAARFKSNKLERVVEIFVGTHMREAAYA